MLDYPFHLIEKYAEIKVDVFERFSLSVPSLIAMSGADDFSSFVSTAVDAGESFINLTDSNILLSRLFIGYEDIAYCNYDFHTSELEILDEDTVFEGYVSQDQTEPNFITSIGNKLVSWVVAKHESCTKFFNNVIFLNTPFGRNFISQEEIFASELEIDDSNISIPNTEESALHDHFYYTLDSVTGLADVSGEVVEEDSYGISGAELERLLYSGSSKIDDTSADSSVVDAEALEVASKNSDSSFNDDISSEKSALTDNFISQDLNAHISDQKNDLDTNLFVQNNT